MREPEINEKFDKWNIKKTLRSNRTYLVNHPERKGEFVLKVPRPGQPASPKNIIDEIKVLKRVGDHKNVVTLVDYNTDKENPWYVMEYYPLGPVSVQSLKKWSLTSLNSLNNRLDEVAKALGYMNSQGVHTGIELDLLLDEYHFVLSDFEASSIIEHEQINPAASFMWYAKEHEKIKKMAKPIIERRQRERAEGVKNNKIQERNKRNPKPPKPLTK